jgi:hypothetical protein
MNNGTDPDRFAVRIGHLVIVILVIISYIVIHAHRYQNCVNQPGIFAWPNGCIQITENTTDE